MEDSLGRDGMPLVRYRRTPWFGVSNASFVRELLEVVVSRQFIWYKNYVGIRSGVQLFLGIQVFLGSSLLLYDTGSLLMLDANHRSDIGHYIW